MSNLLSPALVGHPVTIGIEHPYRQQSLDSGAHPVPAGCSRWCCHVGIEDSALSELEPIKQIRSKVSSLDLTSSFYFNFLFEVTSILQLPSILLMIHTKIIVIVLDYSYLIRLYGCARMWNKSLLWWPLLMKKNKTKLNITTLWIMKEWRTFWLTTFGLNITDLWCYWQ